MNNTSDLRDPKHSLSSQIGWRGQGHGLTKGCVVNGELNPPFPLSPFGETPTEPTLISPVTGVSPATRGDRFPVDAVDGPATPGLRCKFLLIGPDRRVGVNSSAGLRFCFCDAVSCLDTEGSLTREEATLDDPSVPPDEEEEMVTAALARSESASAARVRSTSSSAIRGSSASCVVHFGGGLSAMMDAGPAAIGAIGAIEVRGRVESSRLCSFMWVYDTE